jgi:hypothetical protein
VNVGDDNRSHVFNVPRTLLRIIGP